MFEYPSGHLEDLSKLVISGIRSHLRLSSSSVLRSLVSFNSHGISRKEAREFFYLKASGLPNPSKVAPALLVF